MVDRVTTYFGQLARETDVLLTGQNGMVGLAKLSAAVLGSTTIVNGFTVTPTGPASLNVILTAGEIYQLENLEQSTWSSLSTDTHTILKQGILLDPTTFGITPPGTVGFSQVFLIEVQYQDLDSGSLVLPYYNAGNPALPFSGPGNAGTAQNTVRKGIVAAQVKAGIAATTGTQVAPTADAGWTGIYTVTVANGASTITSGNISKLAAAPFIPVTLPNVPITSQAGGWIYARDTGTLNNIVVTLNPVPTQYTEGMLLHVKMLNAPTGPCVINANGLGNKSIVKPGGAALSGLEWNVGDVVALRFDGTYFQITSSAKQTLAQNLTIYVNGAIGNDTNDGTSNTSGHALATIQAAINMAFNYAPSQYAITIQIAGGTYARALTPTYTGPTLVITGASAASVLVDGGTAGPAITVQGPNTMTVNTLTGQNAEPNGPSAIFLATQGATMTTSGTASNGSLGAVFQATRGATMNPGNHTFQGNTGQLFLANFGASLNLGTNTFTIANAITLSDASANASSNGSISVSNPAATFVNAASVTGKKFSCSVNGTIVSSGNGVNYFPGTVAGTTATGGQYV